jgi:acetate kinase
MPEEPIWEAGITWTADGGRLAVRSVRLPDAREERLPATIPRREAVTRMLRTLWGGPGAPLSSPDAVDAVGHRVVQGGSEYRETARVTPELQGTLIRLAPLAPAHNPAAVEGMEAARALLGDAVPQYAVFDTAFHRTLPDAAAIYPGPYDWLDQGIRRYGFHGISHQYVAGRAAQVLGRTAGDLHLITCHLGNGCSLCAVRGGKSVDTTMGFTPLDGLMMGTRSGSVDPGILLYLLREKGVTADELDEMLNTASGLKGVSGISGDMRHVIAALERGDVRARLAFDAFIHRLRWHIGAMLPSLNRLDALVFTAGIGENSAAVRAAACEGLGFIGVRLDPGANEANEKGDRDVAAADSLVRVLVVRTEEDWAIAREIQGLLPAA